MRKKNRSERIGDVIRNVINQKVPSTKRNDWPRKSISESFSIDRDGRQIQRIKSPNATTLIWFRTSDYTVKNIVVERLGETDKQMREKCQILAIIYRETSGEARKALIQRAGPFTSIRGKLVIGHKHASAEMTEFRCRTEV